MVQQIDDPAVSPHVTTALIDAIRYSGEQLSMLMDRVIELRGTAVERVRLERLPDLLGGAERPVVAIYLAFSEDIDGHVLLLLAPEVAAQLAAILLMAPEPSDGELGDMELSALGEVGNITTAACLNALAAACGLAVYPSPPVVARDMLGALLDGIVIELSLDSAYALLLHTIFEVEGDRLAGDLMLLPTAASCAHLEGLLDPCQA